MPHLYVVGTPIGNLSDLSARAKETLAAADAILCEDTRVTSKLLASIGVRRTLIAYHQHSDTQRMKQIVELMREGKSLALVTDAGTPGISDPGGKLVEMVVRELPEVVIAPIPGPSALVAALSVCGFPCDEFLFMGFPPNKKGRNAFFKRVSETDSTVAFYESTHRILKSLEEVRRVAGSQVRRVVVCRELTKLHETVYRGTTDEIIKQLESTSTKGEFVVVLGPR